MLLVVYFEKMDCSCLLMLEFVAHKDWTDGNGVGVGAPEGSSTAAVAHPESVAVD